MLTILCCLVAVASIALSSVAFWQGWVAIQEIRRIERELTASDSVGPRV